ncbi:linoleate 13S-lipoxygenase 3-1, chloroplastic-like protein [Tanacetum coccineum]
MKCVISLLSACASIPALIARKEIHGHVISIDQDEFVATALINMYMKCGRSLLTLSVFDQYEIKPRDPVIWNAMISGYGRNGETEAAFNIFKLMQRENVKPNSSTFNSVLSVCRIDEARELLLETGEASSSVLASLLDLDPEKLDANLANFVETIWGGKRDSEFLEQMCDVVQATGEKDLSARIHRDDMKDGLARRIFSKDSVDNTWLLEATDKFIQRQPKAIEENKLFIIDYHDIYLPFLDRINALDEPHVCSNDAGVHQLSHHWLQTHAAMEPFILSAHRQLSAMHPIYKLLDSHMRYTLEINAIARQDLLNADGVIEQGMEISAAAYKHWRFDLEGLPADLIRRGMVVPDPSQRHGIKLLIEDYPYASDGLLIWEAIQNWVQTYVTRYYPDPLLVCNDRELQAWYAEVINVGHADLRHENWWPTLANA